MPLSQLFWNGAILKILIGTISVVCSVEPSSAELPVVRTDRGLVAGTRINVGGRDIDAFLGIPYAEPPVGDLRFRNPVDKGRWDGILNATSKPKPCWQIPFPVTRFSVFNYSTSASEDCLYLNIWRRADACPNSSRCDQKRPVIVFIHGGAFQWGDSSLFVYDAANFVALSDVIYVTFNYRLGIFGFLSLETPELPGNMGLWDQNLVLKWVRRNIGDFGGDPDAVTLRGQSSGGISVALHAVSPQSRDLFKRMILESGTGPSMIGGIIYRGVSKFTDIAGILGCYNTAVSLEDQVTLVMACLRNRDASEITAKIDTLIAQKQLFSVVYGDEFLPFNPLSLETWRNMKPKEILLGTVQNEGALFFLQLQRASSGFSKVLSLEYRLTTTLVLSQIFGLSVSKMRDIVEVYFGDRETEHDADTVMRIVSEMLGDSIFNCPTQLFADVAAERGPSLYRYVFAHRPSYSVWPEWMGVVHADDIMYTTGSLPFKNDPSRYTQAIGADTVAYFLNSSHTPQEDDLLKDIVSAWTSFVRNGKPVISGSLMEWPKYSAQNPQILSLQPGNYTTFLDRRKKMCELWRPFLMQTNVPSESTRTPTPPKKLTKAQDSPSRRGKPNSNELSKPSSTTSPWSPPTFLVVATFCMLVLS